MSNEHHTLRGLVEVEIERYAEEARQSVDTAVAEEFSFSSILLAELRHLREDGWRLTLNFILALPTLIVRRGATLSEKLGFYGLQRTLDKVPLPIPTAFEREMAETLERRIFALGKDRDSPVLKRIDASVEIKAAIAVIGDQAAFLQRDQWIRDEVNKCLERWTNIRMQIACALSSLAVLLISFAFFSESTHVASMTGRALVDRQLRDAAVNGFFLGRGLGQVFYSFSPPNPTITQGVIAWSATVCVLALLTFVVNVASDPLQMLFGSQRRQLLRTIDEMEEHLTFSLKRELRRVRTPGTKQRFETMGDVLDAASESGRRALQRTSDRAKDIPTRITQHLLGEWDTLVRAFGPRGVFVMLLAYYGGGAVLLYYAHDRSLANQLSDVRQLVQSGAFARALASIDVLRSSGNFDSNIELIALRAHALCKTNDVRACAEEYERLLRIEPRYARDEVVATTLVDSLASTGHWYVRRVIVDHLGAEMIPRLRAIALEQRPVERWAIAATIAQLGDKEQPFAQYLDIDMKLARRCKDKSLVIEKIVDTNRSELVSELRSIAKNPYLKCVHDAANAAVARLAP